MVGCDIKKTQLSVEKNCTFQGFYRWHSRVLFNVERWPPKTQEQCKPHIAQRLFVFTMYVTPSVFLHRPKQISQLWLLLLPVSHCWHVRCLIGLLAWIIYTSAQPGSEHRAFMWGCRQERWETASLIQPPLCRVTHYHDSFALVFCLKLCARFKAVTILPE